MPISSIVLSEDETPLFLLKKLGEYYPLLIEEFEKVLAVCGCAGISYRCNSLSNDGFYFSVVSSDDITVNYQVNNAISMSADALGLAITYFLLWSLSEDDEYNHYYWSLVESMEGTFPLVIDYTKEHPEKLLIDDFIYGIIQLKLEEAKEE